MKLSKDLYERKETDSARCLWIISGIFFKIGIKQSWKCLYWATCYERNAVGIVRGLKIFEVGCGPGILAEYLIHEGAKVVGFDVSPKMIELAKNRNPKNATFFVADGAKPLPLDSSQMVIWYGGGFTCYWLYKRLVDSSCGI